MTIFGLKTTKKIFRLLKRCWKNQTFRHWINALRINEAIVLLESNPGFTCVEIAERTGFSNYSYFSVVFKEVMEETISAWKRK